jgi:RNA polymerase sigma-70 factor (ECF subfamily)
VTERLDDREEVEEWIAAYVDRLTRLAYTYMRDWATAEDAVQEAFVKVYQLRSQLRQSDNPFLSSNRCRFLLSGL